VADFTKLYERLKKGKIQILEKLDLLMAHAQPQAERREGSPFGKREEEAEGARELEKRMALEKRLRASLAEIERALQKYQAGTYGLCDSCGKAIEEARLEALPQANLCLDCKARQAKDAKGTR